MLKIKGNSGYVVCFQGQKNIDLSIILYFQLLYFSGICLQRIIIRNYKMIFKGNGGMAGKPDRFQACLYGLNNIIYGGRGPVAICRMGVEVMFKQYVEFDAMIINNSN